MAHVGVEHPSSSSFAKPLAPSAAAEYLRDILTCEESLRAAFEPVLRASRCFCPEGVRIVDRGAFAQAVVRISVHFNPSEPMTLRMATSGPPYSVEEALGHFRVALRLLADRLEEICGTASPSRLPLEQAGVWESRQGSRSPRRTSPRMFTVQQEGSVRAAEKREGFESAEDVERQELTKALEASQSRISGLRRALAREDQLLLHQAGETRRLEQLRQALEDQDRRRWQLRESTPPPKAPRDGRRGHGREAEGEHEANSVPTDGSPGPGPMSLEDLKKHLRTVQLLKRRVVALEGELDGREDEVAELSAELEARSARASKVTGNASRLSGRQPQVALDARPLARPLRPVMG